MSFIRTKIIKGKPYYYLVESKRDKSTGKVKQIVLKYLGTKKPKGFVQKRKLKSDTTKKKVVKKIDFDEKPTSKKKIEPKDKYSGWDRENLGKDMIAFLDKSGENEITVAKMSTGEWEVNPSTIIFETQRFKTKKEAMDFAKEQMEKNSPEKVIILSEKERKKYEKFIDKDYEIDGENGIISNINVDGIEVTTKEGLGTTVTIPFKEFKKTLEKPKKKVEPEIKPSKFVSEKIRKENRPESKYAHVDDMDIDRLYLARVNINHDPDGVAISLQNSYVKDVDRFAQKLMNIAETPEQRIQAENEIKRYKAGYIQKYLAVADADSRTASSFITGGSNFPKRQNDKRMATARKRMDEYMNWKVKAEKSAIKNVEKAFTGDISDRELEALKKSADWDLETVQNIDKKTERYMGFTRSAFVNSLAGKLERQLKNGNVKLVEQTLDYVKEQEQKRGMKKPIFSKRHGIFKKLEKAKTEKPTEKPKGINKIMDYKGVSVVNNNDIDRVQLLFDEKPNEEIRTQLKRNGWHWSKREEAWQRKSTQNAITDSRILLGKHFEVD